jgi:hypothetical protein
MAIVKFSLLNPKTTGFSFVGYNDEDYNEVFFQTGVDKFGNPVKKRIKFKRRVEEFNDGKKMPIQFCPKDEKGNPIQMTEVEFIRDAPMCLKEGEERKRWHRYKELDYKKAAKVSNARAKEVFKAQSLIHNCEDDMLFNLSALFGYIGDDKEMQLDMCLKACEDNPSKVIEAAGKDDTEYRATLKELISKGIVARVGSLIEYKAPRAAKAITLGLDDDEAIVKMMKDKPLYLSLKKRLEK